MHIATISSQRQITLPKALLDAMSLSSKDRVIVSQTSKGILLQPVNTDIAALAGSLKQYVQPSKLGVPFEEVRRIAIEHMVQERVRGSKEST